MYNTTRFNLIWVHNDCQSIVLIRLFVILYIFKSYGSTKDALEEPRIENQTVIAILYTLRTLANLKIKVKLK